MKHSIQILVIIFFMSTGLTACSEESRPPNIVFILADDMGYGDLSVQNSESKISTHNLDQLASQGMRFTDAHSPSSVCSPTRYGILTGRYGWRSRLKKHVLWEWDEPLIEDGRITVANILKDAGYDTALIGKWHLGWNWPSINNQSFMPGDTGEFVDFSKPIGGGPTTVGFDYYFGDDVPNFPPYAFIENDRVTDIPTIIKPDHMYGTKGVMVDGWKLESVMPTIKNKAVDYINTHVRQSGSKPYFLFVSLTAPHTPIVPADEYVGKSQAGAYGDFVYQVDDTVGAILNALDDTGQRNDTIVIFTSDNGSPGRDGENSNGEINNGEFRSVLSYGHNPSRPWRGIKADVWEGGHRVPFIVRWPDKVAANSINNEAMVLSDLMATVTDILNSRLPEDAGEDSLSILPLMLGQDNQDQTREAIVLHSYEGVFVVRQGRWKLIQGCGSGGFSDRGECLEGDGWQLYNLDADPFEESNIYSAHPEIVSKLSALLDNYKKSGRSVNRRTNQ